LHSDEVHLRQQCAGTLKSAATQKAPQGCTSLEKQSAITATAAIFPSGWAAFNSGFHRLLWHGENLQLQSQTGCQIQGNLSAQLEVKNFINPTEKTVLISQWLFLSILGQAV
jgi:hypothetical protein